jgi:hypothetical protein
MRTVTITVVFIIGLLVIHTIPELLLAITPEWIITAIVIFMVGMLPVALFIKTAAMFSKSLKGRNN